MQIDRNDEDLPGDGTVATKRHARDADTIAGDNADIIRIVGVNGVDVNPSVNPASPLYVTFNYDNYDPNLKIVVRGVRLLDYTPGGPDFRPDLFSLTDPALDANPANNGFRDEFGIWAAVDIGGHDEVHGETGDDTIYVGGGNDRVFGDADDDDAVGGWGQDWISGGTGSDGILGDDGRIFTSRNSATYGEPLYGVLALLASDPDNRSSQGNVLSEHIYTPGQVQVEDINVAGELKKAVDLTPYNLRPNSLGADDPLFDPILADDILFGGLGMDFMHGGGGDDAMGGGEALPESYTQRFDALGNVVGVVRTDFTRPWNPGDILKFGADTDPWNAPKPIQSRLGEFFLYNEYDPRRVILFKQADGSVWGPNDPAWSVGNPLPTGFVTYFLNLVADEGPLVNGAVEFAPNGTPIAFADRNTDGDDAMFGDEGNDWMLGGTGRDHVYGGWGNDLLNADDVLGTENPDPPANSPGQLPLGGTDETPDTHPIYEDRVFGGAGLDILIGNTGGDRLIDWVGEFNSLPRAVRAVRHRHGQPAGAAPPVRLPVGPGRQRRRGRHAADRHRPAELLEPLQQRGASAGGAVRRAGPGDAERPRLVAGPDRRAHRPAGGQRPGRQTRRAAERRLQRR